jgi:hypothetical protein
MGGDERLQGGPGGPILNRVARPEKLLSTCGCESRRGKSSGRLVADPGAGAKSPVLSGVTKASREEGASRRPVTEVNPRRCLDRFSTERAGRPSRTCHGEGNRLRSPRAVDQPRGRAPAGLLRGTGDGTCAQPTAEQERPSLVALEWDNRRDKAEPKRAGAKRESEEAVVPAKRGRRTSWREGPLLESSFRRR